MSALGLDTSPPADEPPPFEGQPELAHSPRRSFSQPQFPYQFGRTAAYSAAPSIREAAVIRVTGRPSTAHARGNPQLGFTPMCASARTSYTRVDQTAPGTPQPELAELSPSQYALDVDAEMHRIGGDEHTDELDDSEKASPMHLHHEQSGVPQMPQVALTFLTISGKRRTMSFDPEATIGRVKELVWNAWPNEWQDERPPAPSYLRILYLGKILQDEETLSKWAFPITQPDPSAPSPQATVVHLSVRSVPPPTEDAPKKRRGFGAGPGDEEGSACGCCGCVIC
ncbi:ubiquitin-related domain-containing protein [Fomitopsis betulina]|nr:ubiquitin-related domain-containing protein [Fomitopsis betulina]